MAPDARSPRLPIGQIAVEKGYCTEEQVEEALDIQRQEEARGRPRPLTGIVMVRHGIISTGELIDVLRAYEQQGQE